jgi:hypothetical protein
MIDLDDGPFTIEELLAALVNESFRAETALIRSRDRQDVRAALEQHSARLRSETDIEVALRLMTTDELEVFLGATDRLHQWAEQELRSR